MIQISRSLARQLRAVFRKLASRSTASIAKVSIATSSHWLRIRLYGTDILSEYQQPGEFGSSEFVIPLQALADFEGKSNAVVTLESGEAGSVQVRWDDGGVPQVVSYQTEDLAKLPDFPQTPSNMTSVEPGILNILAEASASATPDNGRYATNNIQLKGDAGVIVATDGHQLLQTSFSLPWTEDVLVRASSVYGAREIQNENVSIGKTDGNVVIQTGAWTLYLPIDKDGRFPNVESVIPKPRELTTHCHFDQEDREFLAKSLARLPGADDNDAPVTLDVNGEVCVRAKASGHDQTVELLLARSTTTGTPSRLMMNRHYLARAVELGLSDLHVQDAKRPVVFQDEKSKFIVMPLTEGKPLAASDQAIRIASTNDGKAQPTSIRRTKPVDEPKVTTNGDGHHEPQPAINRMKGIRTRKAKSSGLVALIEEADALKHAMRELCSRSHKLVVALRRHRKQTRLVQSSLKALKDLQHIDA